MGGKSSGLQGEDKSELKKPQHQIIPLGARGYQWVQPNWFRAFAVAESGFSFANFKAISKLNNRLCVFIK